MARVSVRQHTFARGEIRGKLRGRQDTELYYAALGMARNYIVDGLGTLERRPYSRFYGRTKNDGAAALRPFVYSPTQSYVLEFGDLYMRAWYDGGQVLDGGSPEEITTPWSADDAEEMDSAQDKDVMFCVHGDHQPQKITRVSASEFAIEAMEFEDGPFDDPVTGGTTVKPADQASYTPKMTGLTAPSGTVDADASPANAYLVFDQNTKTEWVHTGTNGWVEYNPGSGTAIVDSYMIRATDGSYTNQSPTAWQVEGWDGSNWVTIDARQNEVGWAGGEARYYKTQNKTAFSKYRFNWSAVDGNNANTRIAEISFTLSPDSQTAFNLTASAVTGINGGAGFQTTDVGRLIRLQGSDGHWRSARIASRTSTTVVKIKIYGQALPDKSPLINWRMGTFYDGNWPTNITFHDNRLCLALKNRVYLSFNNDYTNFSPTDPDGTVNPDNAITVVIPSMNSRRGASSEITFLQTLGFQLIVGTPGGLHTIQSTSFGEGLEPETATRRPQDSRGAARIAPVLIGDSVLFAHASRLNVMGTYFKQSYDRLGAQDLSLPSNHLLLGRVRGIVWQEEPYGVAWAYMDNGDLASLTIQPEEKVQAWCSHAIGGRYIEGGKVYSGRVESMASVPAPDSSRDVVYMVVKRTIDGDTVRFIEGFEPAWQEGQDIRDSWYLDAGLKYEGNTDAAKTITFTGTGAGARSAVTNFTSPALVDGDTLQFHDGERWHHGIVSAVDGSNNFTWTPTTPNDGPGAADGVRWHDVDGTWEQLEDGDQINVWAQTYVAPISQTGISRWSIGTTTVSGLDDYEGETLDLLIDGTPSRGHTVASGAISGLPAGHVILAGFPAPCYGSLLPIEAGSQNGSAQGKQRPVYEVAIDMFESRSLEAGTGKPSDYNGVFEFYEPVEFPDESSVIEGQGLAPFSGLIRIPRDEQGGIGETGSADNPAVAWRVSDPLPSTIRGVITRLSTSDGR